VEQCICPDGVTLLDKGDAARADHPFELLDGFEMGIDEGFIDELPEMLGGLQFGAVRRLIDKPDAVRHNEVFGAVPSSAIEAPPRRSSLANVSRPPASRITRNRPVPYPKI
jgi:hypothetical protein